MATQRFKKIKYDGDTVSLTWFTAHNADRISHTLTSPGRPKDALPGSLNAFIPTALHLLEYDDDYRAGLKVRGLSIIDGRDGEGRMLIMTLQKQLDESDAPFIFNTPLMKEADTGDIGKLLDKAEQMATEFLRGERFELDLLTEAEAAAREEAQLGMRFEVNTGKPLTDTQIRDTVRGIGYAIPLGRLRALSNIERDMVIDWIGRLTAAHLGATPMPDEPTCLADVAITVEREEALIAAGPYFVAELRSGDDVTFAVEHRDTHVQSEALVDFYDAQYCTAIMNLGVQTSREMNAADAAKWLAAGPWSIVDENNLGEVWIESGSERERCASFTEANDKAARYNRTIGERAKHESDDLWDDQAPVSLDTAAVDKIKTAATDAGEASAE